MKWTTVVDLLVVHIQPAWYTTWPTTGRGPTNKLWISPSSQACKPPRPSEEPWWHSWSLVLNTVREVDLSEGGPCELLSHGSVGLSLYA